MNALEIKIFLFKNGLTISKIAKAVQQPYGRTFDTTRNAITQLFYHDKWDAKLAALIKKEFQLEIKKPRRPQTVSEAVRLAA